MKLRRRRGGVPEAFGEGTGNRIAWKLFEKVDSSGAILAPVSIKNRQTYHAKRYVKINAN
jgi:hypothetical protein